MKFYINSSETNQRLDKWIKRKFPGITQSLLEKLFRKKIIKLNGKKVKSSYKIKNDDEILLPGLIINNKNFKKRKILKKNLAPLTKKIINSIIFKDDNKIIINKPSGIAIHKGTKTDISLDDIKDKLRFDSNEDPKIVHRLDKETSGLLILARNYKESVYLSQQFKEKKIIKFYLGILNDIPHKDKGVIISKNKVNKNSYSKTNFFLIKKINKRFCLVLFQPITGTKRQIREHCFKINCPILGDKKFYLKKNNTSTFSKNFFLHSYKLKISYKNNIVEEFTAPLPIYFKKFCLKFKLPHSTIFLNNFINTQILKGAKN